MELDYPSSSQSLHRWYSKYKNGRDLHPQNKDGNQNPLIEEKRRLVNYYLGHRKCVNRTCKKLGYLN